MLLPATPGWASLPVVVGVPRHSWLRVPDAVPRHSWLGSAGGDGVRLPTTPAWGPPVVVGCVSRLGVSLVVCVCGVCGCARWPCCVLCCVFVVSALLVVWCGGAVGVSPACAGVCGCVCVVCWWSAVWCPRPLPLLAVSRGRGSPPFLAGVHWLWWWGPWCPSPWSWCVCVRCVALCVGVGRVGGGSWAVWLPCVCVCVLAVCGWWGVSYLWLVLVVGRHGRVQKAEEEVL